MIFLTSSAPLFVIYAASQIEPSQGDVVSFVTIVPIIIAIITVISTVVVAKVNKKGNRENLLIDQLQEEIKNRDDAITHRDKIIQDKDAVIDKKDIEIRGYRDYVGQLRKHIADGNPPPPPIYPSNLQA